MKSISSVNKDEKIFQSKIFYIFKGKYIYISNNIIKLKISLFSA